MIIEEFMAPEPGEHMIRAAFSDHLENYTNLEWCRKKNLEYRYIPKETFEIAKQKAVEAAEKAYPIWLSRDQKPFQGWAHSESTDINIIYAAFAEPTVKGMFTLLGQTIMVKKYWRPKFTSDILIKVSARRTTYAAANGQQVPAVEIADGVFAVHGAFHESENFCGLLQEIVANDAPLRRSVMEVGHSQRFSASQDEASYLAEIDAVGRIFVTDAFWNTMFYMGGVTEIKIG